MMIKQAYAPRMTDTMVEVFKTDVQNVDQSVKLIRKLRQYIPGIEINFDLEDCDRVLRIEGEHVPVPRVIKLMNNNGYYCELL
ncbi:hypothetical protein [Mucilaginibacter sp. SG564]|uniref:hypothetical protein n=1 Tax=unclassified Mucilaginibacter TaxID=2617802 RepID=UPI001C12AB30|nr:hypothetical protein [Mucilaginibacter sp. SG564]NOW94206.1 hypothetical protein [Mucilaginibacter sp. SG564]